MQFNWKLFSFLGSGPGTGRRRIGTPLRTSSGLDRTTGRLARLCGLGTAEVDGGLGRSWLGLLEGLLSLDHVVRDDHEDGLQVAVQLGADALEHVLDLGPRKIDWKS